MSNNPKNTKSELTKAEVTPPSQSFEDKVAAAVAKVLESSLPLMAGVMAQTMANAQATAKTSEAQLMASYRMTGEKCQECEQYLPAGVKQGEHKHKKFCSFPRNKHHGKWWPGVKINSVRYLSNGPGHYITVPADSACEEILERWENEEEQNTRGRVAEHNAGDVSNPREAHIAGWR